MDSTMMPLSDQVAGERPVTRPVTRPECYAPAKAADVIRVGVIGYGYWGPNVVRNLHALDNCEVDSICDRSAAALRRANRIYPGIPLTTDLSEVLTSPAVD